MEKKTDIIAWLGLEGAVSKRSPLTESLEEVASKKPADICFDIRILLDMIDASVNNEDIDSVIKCLSSIEGRVIILQKVANAISAVRKSQKK